MPCASLKLSAYSLSKLPASTFVSRTWRQGLPRSYKSFTEARGRAHYHADVLRDVRSSLSNVVIATKGVWIGKVATAVTGLINSLFKGEDPTAIGVASEEETATLVLGAGLQDTDRILAKHARTIHGPLLSLIQQLVVAEAETICPSFNWTGANRLPAGRKCGK